MNYPESVRFLYALGNETKTIRLGLERMTATCAALSNPERELRFVHVAGTNGKGSTCAMIESGLRAAGLRTGLYTSPHLVSPTERICINGEPVSEAAFAAAFDRVHSSVKDFPEHPTYFETVTAMGFLLFAEAKCDMIVLEVGLGGRLDATNVVTPNLCVITPVSFDHQSYLGNSLTEIAGEKAGIFKPDVPAVIAAQPAEACAAIERKAAEVGVRLHHLSECDDLPYRPSLLGRHQIANAHTARLAMSLLGVNEDAIRQGIETTRWPGRLERVSDKPEVYLDGAHNVAGAAALADFIRDIRRDRKVWMVFSIMRDKEIQPIADQLFPLADELILTAPKIERSMPPDQIPAPPHRRLASSVADALTMLEGAAPDDLVFITGSLFLVGEARALLVP